MLIAEFQQHEVVCRTRQRRLHFASAFGSRANPALCCKGFGDGEQTTVLPFGDGRCPLFDDVMVGDEFAVAGDEEAGASGDFFAGGVGDDQQHHRRSRFFRERFEINRFRLRANGGGEDSGENQKQQERAFHSGSLAGQRCFDKPPSSKPAAAKAQHDRRAPKRIRGLPFAAICRE